jgi:TatD DNase family protein
MTLVDSHCHIDAVEFDDDRDAVVKRASEVGVKYMLNVATGDPATGALERGVAIAGKYENVFAAAGIHPHDAKLYNDDVEEQIAQLIVGSEKAIAWGEIGLDFHYDNSPRDVQKDVFRRQIRAAERLGVPIIIHSRSANDETVKILREECSGAAFVGGVMHCFAGTPEMVEQLLPLGFYFSFAGNVTFKKADDLREAAGAVPIDRMLVETDCPYLTPVPHRGKRNEPAFVMHTADFLASLKDVEPSAFAEQTTQNFLRAFGLPRQ